MNMSGACLHAFSGCHDGEVCIDKKMRNCSTVLVVQCALLCFLIYLCIVDIFIDQCLVQCLVPICVILLFATFWIAPCYCECFFYFLKHWKNKFYVRVRFDVPTLRSAVIITCFCLQEGQQVNTDKIACFIFSP